MTNEEVIEELKRIDTDLLKTADCGNKTSDRMAAGRGRKAVGLAIEAVENQERYRNALEMAVHDSDKQGTDIWCHDCPYGDDERLNHCWECGVEYYKRRAGIDS